MKELPLTRGMVAIIDDTDFEKAGHFKWTALVTSHTCYAHRKAPGNARILLHRFLMNAKPGQVVDHINGNGLDCRRSNMRLTSYSGNSQNRKHFSNSCGYKGVYRSLDKWVATIKVNRKPIYLGRFDSPEKAALAYNKAAVRYFGEYAGLNVIEANTGTVRQAQEQAQ